MKKFYTLVFYLIVVGTLTAQTSLTVDYTKINITPNTLNSGGIALSIQGGKPPYIVEWEHGESAMSIGGLSAGDYQVRIEDSDGNEINKRITIGNITIWQNIKNLNLNNGEIQKTKENGWGNAGLSSTNILKGGKDGILQFTLKNLSANYMIGLTRMDKDAHYKSMEHAIYIHRNTVYVIEEGRKKGYLGKVNLNDVFKIHRKGEQILYYKNDKLFFRSETPYSNASVIVDVSVYSGTLNIDAITSFGYPPSNNILNYTSLKPKVDGSFTTVKNNQLRFRFSNRYANITNNQITYTIYNWERQIKANGNLASLNIDRNNYAFDVSNLTIGEFYTLEVIGNKKQKYYLRFKYVN